MPHSGPFLAFRDALLALDQAERQRLVELLGCMGSPAPPVSTGLVTVLAAIAQLDAEDRERLSKWCSQHMSKWGQFPRAAGLRIKAK